MWSLRITARKKGACGGTQAFTLRTQAVPILSNIQTAACPRSIRHARQTCPQFLRDLQELAGCRRSPPSAASSPPQAAAASPCTTLGAACFSAPSNADSSLGTVRDATSDTICLQTSANTGDRASWRVCNGASNVSAHAPDFFHRNNAISHTQRTDRELPRNTGKQDANQPHRHVVAQRCAAPSRPPSAACAATASSSTGAGPAWSRSSCCPCQRRPSFHWRTVPVRTRSFRTAKCL